MKCSTTDRPSPEDVTPEETARALANGVARLDLDRASAYAGLATLRTAKDSALVREEKMLARKYGDQHPRVAAVGERRAANAIFQRDLAVAHTLAATPPPPADAEAYTFHGHVRDRERKPQPQLTVALYNANGEWIAELGHGCTDENGYFILGGGRVQSADNSQGAATIRVYDMEQKLVHTEAEQLQIAAGKIDYREIILCEEGTCQPPPGAPDQPPPAPVTVPNVVGKTQASAKSELNRAGFTVESSTHAASSKEVGRVLGQKPAAGAKAATGSVVAIIVGEPQPKVAVPDVTDQTLREACTILDNAGLSAGKIEPAGAPLQSPVVKQSPAAGAEVERGTSVDLDVKAPPEKVPVPKVEKRPLGEAKKVIAESGLTVGKIDPADAGDQAIVIAQSPPADTIVTRGSAVDLTMEKDQRQVEVPDLSERSLVEAKRVLDSARLKLGNLKPPDASEKYLVVAQSPKPKTKVPEGIPVDLALRLPTTPKKNAAKKNPRLKPSKKRGSRSIHR
jgi:beta-lactam-binding protein with PASTA domain